MNQKKSYLGYQPKTKNIEKLAKYVEKKRVEMRQVVKTTNPALKNKRF